MSRTYAGRAMAPVGDQMDLIRSHSIRPAVRETKSDTPQHTFTLAKPPAWTSLAKCVGDFATFDDSVGLSAGEAAARCAGCPVIAECLSVALSEEGDLSAGSRFGIRGGLSPKERAAESDKKRAAAKRAAYNVQRLDPEYMARRAERMRESRSVRRVSCLECQSEMRAAHFDRHLATVHGEAA